MTDKEASVDIVFYLRREAQSVIDCGVGDGWPYTQAADEIERLRAAVEAVREIHHQVPAGDLDAGFCDGCCFMWPCPTTKALLSTDVPPA